MAVFDDFEPDAGDGLASVMEDVVVITLQPRHVIALAVLFGYDAGGIHLGRLYDLVKRTIHFPYCDVSELV